MAETLVKCALDESAPWPARISAAVSVLDRAWGKPKDTGAGDAPGVPALRIEFVSSETNETQHATISHVRLLEHEDEDETT